MNAVTAFGLIDIVTLLHGVEPAVVEVQVGDLDAAAAPRGGRRRAGSRRSPGVRPRARSAAVRRALEPGCRGGPACPSAGLLSKRRETKPAIMFSSMTMMISVRAAAQARSM